MSPPVDETPSFDIADVEIQQETTVYDGFFKMRKYFLRHRLFEGGWSEVMSRELFDRGHKVVGNQNRHIAVGEQIGADVGCSAV